MSWPNTSTFLSSGSRDLWWKAGYTNGVTVCAGQGSSVIKIAQRSMGRQLGATWGILDAQGRSLQYRSTQLAPDGAIGEATLAGLILMLTRAGATGLLARVRADFDTYTALDAPRPDGAGGAVGGNAARGQPLSQATSAAVIWVAQNMMPSLDRYEFPVFVAPLYRVAPPADAGDGEIVCWTPGTTPPASTGGTGGASTGGANTSTSHTMPAGTTPVTSTTSTTSTSTSTRGGFTGTQLAIAGLLAAVIAKKLKRR